MSQGPYDAFLSYRHLDKDWVRGKLAPSLEAAGLRICIDYRDFTFGAALLDEMERAVLESRFTLAIYTKAYNDSGFTKLEDILADHLGTEEQATRLIVLIRDGTTPSLRHRARLMLDMSDDSQFDTTVERLIGAFSDGS